MAVLFYVYGFLHSPDYRAAFANDLKKSLPRSGGTACQI
jgi:predicted helicase